MMAGKAGPGMISPNARRQARRLALQALYQWQLTGMDVAEIAGQFENGKDMANVDRAYFRELLTAIPSRTAELDELMITVLDRDIKQVDPVELAIMRIAVYELVYRKEIPYKVIINEAVGLARKFGASQGHAYVNGVVDTLSRKLRAGERGTGETVVSRTSLP